MLITSKRFFTPKCSGASVIRSRSQLCSVNEQKAELTWSIAFESWRKCVQHLHHWCGNCAPELRSQRLRNSGGKNRLWRARASFLEMERYCAMAFSRSPTSPKRRANLSTLRTAIECIHVARNNFYQSPQKPTSRRRSNIQTSQQKSSDTIARRPSTQIPCGCSVAPLVGLTADERQQRWRRLLQKLMVAYNSHYLTHHSHLKMVLISSSVIMIYISEERADGLSIFRAVSIRSFHAKSMLVCDVWL